MIVLHRLVANYKPGGLPRFTDLKNYIILTEHYTNINFFHNSLKQACSRHNQKYYPKFKKWCNEYFYLKHRNETRGAGGIFFDYLNTKNWGNDFNFLQDVGECFLETYPKIIKNNIHKSWTKKDREKLLIKRGRYAEFNLLYDRGTQFGLKTSGNVEAILMSLPPVAKWP